MKKRHYKNCFKCGIPFYTYTDKTLCRECQKNIDSIKNETKKWGKWEEK